METPDLRKPANRKALIGAGALVFLVFVIAISSFFPFIIDPSGWQTVDFLTRELIIVVITISATVTAMFIGQAKNAEDARSNLSKARRRFSENAPKIRDRGLFRQWVKEVLEPADKETKLLRLMAKCGIEQRELLSLEREELKSLVGKPGKINGFYFHAITAEQLKFLIAYKDGKYAIDYVPADYYLTVSFINNDRTRSEKAGSETRTKTSLLTLRILSKIAMGLIISMVFASLVYDATTAQSDGQKAQAWMNFASRMVSLVTSTFSGYLLGSMENDVEADYVNMRCDVQDEFLSSGFKGKSDQEIAKQEYIDSVKEDNVLSLEGKLG